MREPHDRCTSLFRLYQSVPHPRFDNFEQFVLHICSHPTNDPHLIPQVSWLAEPTEIIRWNFPRLSVVLGMPVPWINHVPGESPVWTEAAREPFDRAYARDLEVWNG